MSSDDDKETWSVACKANQINAVTFDFWFFMKDDASEMRGRSSERPPRERGLYECLTKVVQ